MTTKLFRSAKIAWLVSLTALTALAAGCAAPVGSSSGEEPTGSTEQAMAVSCSTPSPTPRPSCRPDLYVAYATSYQEAPGNAANLYPGTYITYEVSNKGAVGAGAFEVEIVDYYDKVLKTVNVPSLAVGQYYDVGIIAPYADGWTRTAIVDPTNEVAETNETNNSFTVQTGLDPSLP